jgi:HD-GYP domain-containing protein (c-di-GMP phosphodiesterase class II)
MEFKIDGLDEELLKIKGFTKALDKEIVEELDDAGIDWRDDLRVNIHKVSGELADKTNLIDAKKKGNTFTVGVSNNLEYAEDYEYGHRQEVGKFVPAIGKRLKKSFVKGQCTFRKAKIKHKKIILERVKARVKKVEGDFSD